MKLRKLNETFFPPFVIILTLLLWAWSLSFSIEMIGSHNEHWYAFPMVLTACFGCFGFSLAISLLIGYLIFDIE